MESWIVVEDSPIEYYSERQKAILKAEILYSVLKEISKLD